MSAGIAIGESEQAQKSELQELRAAFAELMQEKQRIQTALDLRNAALDAATTHFMIVEARPPDYPIVYANRMVAAQHGYAGADALIGQSVSVFSGSYLSEETRQRYDESLARGETARAEMEITRRDGQKFLVGLSTSPLRDQSGRTTHYVTLGADITARIEAETRKKELQEQLSAELRERERMGIELRLAQKLESVGRLAAGLAHEINTPIQYVGDSVHFLRSAIGEIDALLESYRDAVSRLVSPGTEHVAAALAQLEAAADLEFLRTEVPKALDRTLDGAARVADIVRAMKEFAYPDTIEQRPADLNRALETTLVVTRSEYKYAASVQTDFGDLPPVVCNISELNQVFLNLIVNAAHAIQDSGKDAASGVLAVTTRAADGWAEIVVSDNGCGIAPEHLDKVFDPFFTTKAVGRGTGQGLAIAHSIVADKHQGRIDIETAVGVGTRFVVRLPLHGRTSVEGA
jgi:PAS domain S-box-containing protein